MFMEIAIGAIGIGIVLMVGYVVISQIKTALPTTDSVQVANPCYGIVNESTTSVCINTSDVYTAPSVCGSTDLSTLNGSSLIDCPNIGVTNGLASAQTTIFAGFGLIAVGIIVLAAFGLINVFK